MYAAEWSAPTASANWRHASPATRGWPAAQYSYALPAPTVHRTNAFCGNRADEGSMNMWPAPTVGHRFMSPSMPRVGSVEGVSSNVISRHVLSRTPMAPPAGLGPSRARGSSTTDLQSRLTATVDYVGLPRARTVVQAPPFGLERNAPVVRSLTGDRLVPRPNPRRLTAQNLQRNLAPMYREAEELTSEAIPVTSTQSADRRRTSKTRGTHRASKSRSKKIKPKTVSHSESSATEDPIASLNNQIRELVESVGDSISEQQSPVLEQIRAAVGTLAALCETLQRGSKRRTVDAESTADLETPRSVPPLGRKPPILEDSRRLIDDISASITNKVLQNIKREFAQVSQPPITSIDSREQEEEPDAHWFVEKDQTAFEPRPIRSSNYPTTAVSRKDSRPDVQTIANTALYRDPPYVGTPSPFSRRPQPLPTSQPARPLYIPPAQFVPRRATPTGLQSQTRTPPVFARDTVPTNADNSPGRDPTPNRLSPATATRPRSAGPTRRPASGSGPGQRDVIYTLRIDTFQEAPEGKRRSGTNCAHTREVDVVRINRNPDLFVMPDFLTKTECDHIIDQFEQFVQPSALLPSCLSDVRGAVDVAHLPPEATTALGRIVRRLAAVSQRQPKNMDSLTLIQYSPEAVCELTGGQSGAHIIYVFLDEFKEAGGELCFGNVGLKVKPQRGTAMMWRIDPRLSAIERPLFGHSRSVLVAVLS